MTDNEYNELVQALYLGHELTFQYAGKDYFLERRGLAGYIFYDITDKNKGVVLDIIQGQDLTDIVLMFINKPIVNNESFCRLYTDIEIYDIE